MSDTMQGKRVDWPEGLMNPGEYAKHEGVWYAVTPNDHYANLAAHSVTEHEDGTITVSPSIRVYDTERDLWHGFLERGVWRQC
jgi:hypothetical protein